MNFYEAKITYKQKKTDSFNKKRALFVPEDEKKPAEFISDAFNDVNKIFGIECDDKNAFNIIFWKAIEGEADVMFTVDTEISNKDEAVKFIEYRMKENYDIAGVSVNQVKEITTERFRDLGKKAENLDFIGHFDPLEGRIGCDFRDNNNFKVTEEILPEGFLSFEEAMEKSKDFMADDSFTEELERIYSDENEKEYYGNPVHYKLSVSNLDAAIEMARLLSHALKSNCRLAGSRLNIITEITTNCYSESDFSNMFDIAKGNVVVFDLSETDYDEGPFAGSYERVITYMTKLIREKHVQTLCIFVENINKEGFSGKLVSGLAEKLDIIEIKEGKGGRKTTVSYIENLVRKRKCKISGEEIESILPDKTIFTLGEAHEVFNKWFGNSLKSNVYKAYRNCTCIEAEKVTKISKPYDELKSMVGLTEIKEVVDEIIDSARVQKMRSLMGLDTFKTSLHMVFTGNPGSAKTTVARLIAEILTKENILKTGRFIECGRADLVGKYVGWTAKAVRGAFRQAKGGVLFIDEAYSLVDDSNSYGDEAINTIVQEMENHRDDVIVIFAGYPDKMEAFLDKNEGLRSRIAFHLNFPDYNADEMIDILRLMADKKGYRLSGEIEDKCRDIFELAVTKKEFGNGRYARNLLEQAMMAQSRRIIREYKGKKIPRKALVTLKSEDFEVNAKNQFKKEDKAIIGFAV